MKDCTLLYYTSVSSGEKLPPINVKGGGNKHQTGHHLTNRDISDNPSPKSCLE